MVTSQWEAVSLAGNYSAVDTVGMRSRHWARAQMTKDSQMTELTASALTRTQALSAIEAGFAEAGRLGIPFTIAVIDAGEIGRASCRERVLNLV